jgi:hypothetical protein
MKTKDRHRADLQFGNPVPVCRGAACRPLMIGVGQALPVRGFGSTDGNWRNKARMSMKTKDRRTAGPQVRKPVLFCRGTACRPLMIGVGQALPLRGFGSTDENRRNKARMSMKTKDHRIADLKIGATPNGLRRCR